MSGRPPVVLVLGGARSGKSRVAEALARRLAGGQERTGGKALAYIATAEPGDAEMAERIARHRAGRGDGWRTIEEPRDLAGALAEAGSATALVECLTLWLSNLMLAGADVTAATATLLAALAVRAGPTVLVSNEVGWSIVPDNALARRFADAQGRLNQAIAAAADEVHLVAAGLPLRLKPSRHPEFAA